MTCGAHRGRRSALTLAVLLTTRFGFTQRLCWRKLLSRLVVIFSLLLISLPLLTFAYAADGLSLDYMVRSLVWLLGMSLRHRHAVADVLGLVRKLSLRIFA